MSGPVSETTLDWSCQVTAGFLDAAERDLRAVLLARHDRSVAAREKRTRRALPVLRAAGLVLSALGLLLAGWLVVVLPDCSDDVARWLAYHLALAFFAVAAVVFWFMPRLRPALQAWARRTTEARAARLLAPLRRRAPFTVSYALRGGRLETRAEKLRLRRTIRLGDFAAAALTPSLACLYRGRDATWLRRVIYFDDAESRATFAVALRRAGVEVSGVGFQAGGTA